MKKVTFLATLTGALLTVANIASATNGDSLVGIGPIARSMGGVGIAAPQDAISAVFANPAAMCFGPYCPGSQVDLSTTFFAPTTKATVTVPPAGINTPVSAESDSDLFIIPAIGVGLPLAPKWRLGLAAYGVSGMGVDYTNKIPSGLDMLTEYQVMKLGPNIAYQVNDRFSIGASLHIDYASLDLDQGTEGGYTVGAQLGIIYKFEPFSFGMSYVSPQSVSHEDVYDFDNNGVKDDLDLEMPQTFGAGIAWEPTDRFLVEADMKWLNWSDADGYKEFDWNDQWVYALGMQYKATDKFTLRAGFNYGENPIEKHNNFDIAGAAVNVQGTQVARLNYEYFRMIGFPAIVETHVGLGVSYEFTPRLTVNAGYMRALENTMTETGTNGVILTSELAEDNYEIGLSWRF